MSHPDESAVLASADRLVRAFGEGRVEDYFACFHPEATFVFYTSYRRLESRAEWRELWDELAREEGFRVLECESSARRVQLFGDAAVFTHDVRTRVSTHAGEETLDERETIIFVREDGEWFAVHEHLSPAGSTTESQTEKEHA
ncbi:SnoaL-like domain [Rubrobacter radiotolerans]|uniref:Nuclear transport factor 2 family protein n=1 Tax=Rubrobacter radiotolerans TaxID=42256 RepID=A0A023X0V4_RUBRA|nr:nuclear transport factor 2 family protein [Rubrobacter radiotolerans]AHY45630.1 SnoaL-like domain [Rubrobacter radiotolerans]MDX5893044.1 nuclear transport factor 2 family protein [Rubrobacter radiotolerans]SMC02949.1 SnoaL-like domain-containing protein [Rubrobacter radiotolerans DSM 5868]